MRTWTIGSAADCDFVVTRPTVSGHHCRLTETPDGFLLEDLGSSNGTYVNGVRIASPTRIAPTDAITLGLTVAMPWPVAAGAPGVTVVTIGRTADNDIVIEDPRVSGHHARLLIVAGSKSLIEDLGSSNGTFVGSSGERITQAVPITESDTVYFGSLAVPASRLLSGRAGTETAVPPPAPRARPGPAPEPPRPPVSVPPPIPAPVPSPAPETPATATGFDPLWSIVLLIDAPVLAILIVLIFGRQAVATTFALGMAAIVLGATLAVWTAVVGSTAGRDACTIEARFLASPGMRIVTLAVLGLLQCAALLTIVHWGSGLKGDWPAMFTVLVLGAGVGLSLGLVVFAVCRSPAITAAVLIVTLLPMIALGGWIRPLPDLKPAVRGVAAIMPSRWAFEGLLLLESDRHPAPEASEPNAGRDLVEDTFPAETERMGVAADATALGLMLIGLSALTAFLSMAPTASR